MTRKDRAPRRIALCGTAPATRDLVPWNDADLEVWGMVVGRRYLPRCDRWFELHDAAMIALEGPEFAAFLGSVTAPLYVWEPRAEWPTSVAYPLEQMVETYGPYFTSTAAYMLALAIDEVQAGDEIHLYGLDMVAGEEYGHQREGCLYYLGLAEGRGIRVVLPEATPLRKAPLYGIADPAEGYRDGLVRTVAARIDTLASKKAELAVRVNVTQGALEMVETLRPALPDDVGAEWHQRLTKQRGDLNAAFNGVLGQLKEAEYLRGVLGEVRA